MAHDLILLRRVQVLIGTNISNTLIYKYIDTLEGKMSCLDLLQYHWFLKKETISKEQITHLQWRLLCRIY